MKLRETQAITFDDVLLVPRYSEVLPCEVSTKSKLTKKICLNIPLCSAAMDTVTEARMAIAMSQAGGIGIIHKNMSSEAQAAEVAVVKRFLERGVVRDPVVVGPTWKVSQLRDLAALRRVCTFPVVPDGSKNVVGIITRRDHFAADPETLIQDLMTPEKDLITVKEGCDFAVAKQLMIEHRKEKLIVLNDRHELAGVITAKDADFAVANPEATIDSEGRLIVGAAVGTGEKEVLRAKRLVEVGVDVIVVDTAHGHSSRALDTIRQIKKNHGDKVQVIGGNVATADGARAIADAGADGVKVGIGPGSICTTRIVTGVGVPQVTAISDCAEALKGSGIPVIADGGLRYSGDISKALCAGASCCMMGSMLSGTEESPGDVFMQGGLKFKIYRGMGSLGAMQQGSADRYGQESSTSKSKMIPEGIEGRVPFKGSVSPILHQLVGGLKSSMGYLGCSKVSECWDAEFVKISSAGVLESHVHDVQIVQDAPNYTKKL